MSTAGEVLPEWAAVGVAALMIVRRMEDACSSCFLIGEDEHVKIDTKLQTRASFAPRLTAIADLEGG